MRIGLTALSIALVILLASFDKPAKKLFTPPGTVEVNDTLYFDQGEISNGQWKEFEKWTEQQYGRNSEAYKKALPDTTVWGVELSDNDPYIKHYHQDAKYDEFPLVGITYEQATAFCKWRTEQVQQKIKAGKYHNEVLPKSFHYRLPTKAEWENVASAGFDEKALKSMKHFHNAEPYNMVVERPKTDTTHYKPNPDATITTKIYFFSPNKLGLYNLFGNVAEMTSEKGISKGGSWGTRKKKFPFKKTIPMKERQPGWGSDAFVWCSGKYPPVFYCLSSFFNAFFIGKMLCFPPSIHYIYYVKNEFLPL